MNAKIKDLFLKIRRYISVHRYTLYLIIPFLLMDIFTRAFGYAIGYFPTFYPAPNIFTLVWLFLFIGIITCLKGKGCSIAYWVLFILAYVLFLTNTVYYSLTGFYFSFNLMLMASEGSSYIVDTIIHANPIIYVAAIIILIIAIKIGVAKTYYSPFSN